MNTAKKVKHKIIYFIVACITFVVSRISLGAGYFFAKILGKITSVFTLREKRMISANILYTGFPATPSGIYRKLLYSLMCTYIEFVKFAFMSFPKARGYFIIRGENHLREALKKGKGVILLTGHIGNWELLGTYLGKKGYNVSAIYRKSFSELYDSLIRTLRGLNRVRLIDNAEAYAGSMKTLRENGILIILADQNAKRDGEMIDFLGKPAPTPRGPAVFALKSGAALVSAFVIRKKTGFMIEFRNLEYEKSVSRRKTATNIMEAMNREYGRIIGRYPWQWVWFHNRWGIM